MATNSEEINAAKNSIKAILDDSLAMFTNHPTKRNLTEKYNSDMSLAQSYHGRELLELVQNADDAYVGYESKDGKLNDVLIEYIGDRLRVSNRGKVFDKEAVERLSQGNVSGKGIQYIGNKGIGFRSLLNWAKEIRIYSGAYSFGFSKDFANKQFTYLRDNFENVKKEVRDKPELSFPILWSPYWIDENKKESGYDTTIEVLLDESALEDEWNVQKQIEEYDYNVLLFLQNITQISIKTDSEHYGFVKSKKKEDDLLKSVLKKICYNTDETVVEKKNYYCFKPKDEKILLGNSESLLKMTVAVPCSFEPMESKMYTFFPIKNEPCPVPALLHATFLLEQNRSTISNNQLNHDIYKKLLEFYVSTVTEHFSKEQYGNTVAKLLTPFDFAGKYSEISCYYRELCAEKLSIMNVNGGFIPLSRKPRIYQKFPVFFKGEKFELLCQSIDDDRVSNFLKELIGDKGEYAVDDMQQIINACSEKWSVNQRVECFDWWLNEFNNDDWIPNLLKDRDGFWIVDEKKLVFFPPSEDLTSLPDWHGVVLLNRKDGDALDEYIRESHAKKDKRDVINYLNFFNSISFREYSAESLITPLKNAVNGEYERAVDFIQWVRRNNKGASLTSFDKVFPCKDGSVQCAMEVYLGKEYGENSFIPFLAASGKFELESPQKLLGNKDVNSKAELESLKEFLGVFDFVDSPQIVKKDLEYRSWWNSIRGDLSDVDKLYAEDAEDFLNGNISAEGEAGNRRLFEVEITTVDNIGNILNEVSTKQILKWIFGNSNSSAKLRDKIFYQSDEIIYYLPTANKMKYRRLNMRTDSYLWYVFAYTPWLSLGKSGKKYAPVECKFSSRNPIEKELVSESITDDFLEKLSENIEVPSSDIKRLLERLGTDSYFLNLAPDSFYELLLKLPRLKNVGESIKFSHLIYNNCVQAISKSDWYVERYTSTLAGENFKEKGCLLCKNDHSYRPVSEIYFSNSSVLNPLNKALFDIPLKNGRTDAIVEIFKVSRYDKDWESNIKVSSEDISALNEEFKKDWLNFVPYILCLLTESQQSVMIPKFKNLKVDLISNLRNDLGEIIELQNDEYHLVEDENKHFYMYVGSGDLDKYKLSLAVSDLLQKMLDTENKERLDLYSQLFRSDENSKKGLIQEYTYLDALEDCINRFSAVNSDVNPIVKYFTGMHIDIENVETIFNRLYAGLGLKESEQERLAVFLKNNSRDISAIRSILNQDNVSIVEYNRKQLKNKIEEKSQKELFEWALWQKCNKGDDDDRANFRIRKDSLVRDVLNTDIMNTVYFDPQKKLEEVFQTMFGIPMKNFDFNPEQETSCTNVDELYQKNRNRLIVPEGIDENDFLDDSKIKSLLYFDVETVQVKLDEFASQHQDENNNDGEVYISVPANTDVSYDTPLIASMPHNSSGESHSVMPSSRKTPKQNDAKLQNQGYEAEKLVVGELRERKMLEINKFFDNQKYVVEWKSKAAEYFENTDGDDSLGYDILLRSDDGKLLYIDVKSHESEDCSFMMSANEVRFAKAHLTSEKDEYRIIFVSNFRLNAETLSPSISVLPANFLDNPKFEKEYPNVRIFLKEA